MSEDILFELYVFCKALMLGVLLSVAYDIIRISRRIIKRNTVIVAVEDTILSIIAAFIIFNMIYQENYGNLRGYIFSGMLGGMGLYLISMSKPFVNITSKCILSLLQKIINKYKMNKNKIISKVMSNCEKNSCKKDETIK